jgi:transposase
MIKAVSGVRVYLASGNTDMRKSINGLSIIVESRFELDPFSGHLFVFCNRRKNNVKVLYWDRNGFCLWQKRLEKERFRWPDIREDIIVIEERELMWLMEGLEIKQEKAHKKLSYSILY